MYITQRARLTANSAFKLTPEEGNAILARAYGFQHYDNIEGKMSEPIPGLHIIHEPGEILAKDPAHQMIEFVRMATNLSIPGLPNVTKGLSPKSLVACMFNFTNFDALVAYARSEPLDPHSADLGMLEQFEQRHGVKAPGQFLFGRSYNQHTYVIREDAAAFQHYLDQELCLTNLSDLQVALVRTNSDADRRINQYMQNHVVLKGPLRENQSSLIMGAREEGSHLAISIIPDQEYTLEQIVAAHLACLSRNAPKGRSLIIDGVRLNPDPQTIEAGLQLAALRKINVVIAHSSPDVGLWSKMESRLVFGFDVNMEITESDELNLVLTQASTYTGQAGKKLLFIYHTTAGGTRYTAMDLTSDDVASNVVRRIFGKRLA
jgi:hypothetical protein